MIVSLWVCLQVIQDNVDPVFATLLDWPSFSLRFKEVSRLHVALVKSSLQIRHGSSACFAHAGVS